MFIHDGKDKRGSWTSTQNVLVLYQTACTITALGCAGKTTNAVVADARAARFEMDLVRPTQESIDELDFGLFDTLSYAPDDFILDIKIVEATSEPPGDFSRRNHLPSIGDRISFL